MLTVTDVGDSSTLMAVTVDGEKRQCQNVSGDSVGMVDCGLVCFGLGEVGIMSAKIIRNIPSNGGSCSHEQVT